MGNSVKVKEPRGKSDLEDREIRIDIRDQEFYSGDLVQGGEFVIDSRESGSSVYPSFEAKVTFVPSKENPGASEISPLENEQISFPVSYGKVKRFMVRENAAPKKYYLKIEATTAKGESSDYDLSLVVIDKDADPSEYVGHYARNLGFCLDTGEGVDGSFMIGQPGIARFIGHDVVGSVLGVEVDCDPGEGRVHISGPDIKSDLEPGQRKEFIVKAEASGLFGKVSFKVPGSSQGGGTDYVEIIIDPDGHGLPEKL